MNKIGRNDPCPCGSGKKYKKCCGATNVVELSPDRYNAELNRLYEDLLAFAFEEYQFQLQNIIQQYPKPELMEDQLEIYMAGLSTWIIMYVPINDDKRTIFDIFYEKQEKKIKYGRVKNVFASWKNRAPAVYEVLSIENNQAALVELQTQETFSTLIDEDDPIYVEGDIVIGILLPFIDYNDFLLTCISTHDVNEEVYHLAVDYEEEGVFIEKFPDFLADMLSIQSEEFEEPVWDQVMHENVANVFKEHMKNKQMDKETILTGLMVWSAYCQEEDPDIRKPGPSAAALEYIIHRTLFPDKPISQKQLAKEYNTSAGTISKIFRELEDFIGVEMEMFLDMLDVDNDFMDDDEDGLIETMNPMEKEKTMHDLQQLLEAQQFESEEDVQEFMDNIVNSQDILKPVSDSPRDQAQEKLYEAYEANERNRKKLIKEALEIYPHLPDAYLLMAEDAKSSRELYQLYHQAVLAGEKDLGKDFFNKNKGDFWLMPETRPYMRAKQAFAEICYELEDVDSALAHFKELLELNPNDNQGIRYRLLTLYLEEEKYKDAKQLLEQYEGDIAAVFQFNHVLLHYFTKGMTSKTKRLLKQADKQNPFVKEFLTGKKFLPPQMPSYTGIGDEREAVAYVQENAHLWIVENDLLDELKKI